LTGYCVDINRLWVTTNGGSSWNVVIANPPTFSDEISMANAFTGWIGRESAAPNAYKITNQSTLTDISLNGDALGVHAVNTSLAFMCGTNGYVYKTSDGTNWTSSQIVNSAYTLTCVHFQTTNPSTGVVCGSNSSIKVTTNSGTTWTGISGVSGSFVAAYIFD
jgi:photosystem II stability/assembly factor-like uncharacterized protein